MKKIFNYWRSCIKIPSKILLVLFLLSTFPAFAAGDGLVTIKVKDATIREVLEQLHKQNYQLVFNSGDIDSSNKKVSLDLKDVPVQEVLKETFKNTLFSYKVENNVIIVKLLRSADLIKANGVVLDDSGDPLPGVSILVKGLNTGISTDINGQFSLKMKAGEILVFSFIGKQTQELKVNSEKPLRIVLKTDVEEMDEVVITGYQQIEKRQLTSAVSVVKAEDLNVIGSTSIEQMLQGQLSGLSVVNTSTAPGAAPKIRVRGTATIFGNAEPLWVLDGVMLENSVPVTVEELNNPDIMNTFNSVIGGVSPNDIESITVLKDASATAIYGTRAANGVIVVTTKKGKRNGFNVSYRHTSAVSMRPSYKNFDLLDSRERVDLTQQMFDDGFLITGDVGMENAMEQYARGNLNKEEYIKSIHELETRNTDWFDILFRNAYTQTHNISVSGGSEKMDYYVSLNYDNQQGIDKVSNYKNFGGLAKVNTELFKGVRLGASIQAGRRDRESYLSTVDPFRYAVRTSRTIPLYDESGDLFFYTGSNWKAFNILNEQDNTSYESTQTDLKGILNLEVQLFKGLKYKGFASYSSSTSSAIEIATEKSCYAASIRGYDYGQGDEEDKADSSMPYGGVYNEKNYESRTSLIRNNLEYKTMFSDELSFDAMIGQEFRTTVYKGLNSRAYGYMHDRGKIFYQPGLSEEFGHILRNNITRNTPKRSYVSYYAVLSAMYKNRYVINGNVRFDGSNLFGSNPKNRYLPLWSVSAKWNINKENFLQDAEKIDNLALRLSYGWRGNIVDESSPQIIASALPPNPSSGLLEMEVIQSPNPDLKWEKTSSFNIGIEMSFFNNRLTADIDYYKDLSSDLIASKDISTVTGFKRKFVNYADVRNQGVDVSLGGYIIRNKKVSWMATLNLGYVKNEVTKCFITPQTKNLVKSTYVPGQVYEGRPVNGMFSYRYAKLDERGLPLFYNKEDELIGASDTKIVGDVYNNLENLKYEGSRDPILSGGLSNVVRYKNFTLSCLFTFGLKNVVRLPDFAYTTPPHADENANKHILERWRKPGDENTKIVPALNVGTGYFKIGKDYLYTTDMFNKSSETVVPGDYLRMKNLMVEYRLPQRLVQKVIVGGRQLSSISFKFQADNIFVIADGRLKGYDPETINYTTNGFGSMPLQRTFTLGMNINF